jgi:PAS domain S-box-containing protein
MQANLKLTSKAFILVAVPLLFQVSFVAALAWLLKDAEQEARRQSDARQVISAAGQLTKCAQDCAVIIYMYKRTRSKSMVERYEAEVAQMREEVQELRNGAVSSEQEKQLAAQIGTLTEQVIAFGHQMLESVRRGDDLDHGPALEDARLGTLEYSSKLMRAVHELGDLEKERNDAQSGKEEQKRQIIWNYLIAGIAFNIGLAIFLALLFTTSTSKRLRLLMDNSMRLASGMALNQPLGGKDEIGQLDRTFHAMAKALQDAAKKERAIVENALDVICSISPDLTFLALSPACEEVFGSTEEALLGSRITELLTPAQGKNLFEAFESIRKGASSPLIDSSIIRPDGSTADIRWSVHWSEQEKSYFCVAHDATAQRQVERLKQEFVSMISHDLRTPLMSVQASLCLLGAGASGQLSASAERNVADAERNVNYIIGLINSLLDVERIASNKLEVSCFPIELRETAETAIQAVQAIADKRQIKVVNQCPETEIYADSGRIVQVLINLVSNALKFSDTGSTIRLTAEELPDAVEIQVIDQGRGIPASHLEAVFARFGQVEKTDSTVKGGAGLGLAICKAIVDAHGGTIGVQSEPGKGSKFWFRLPHQPSITGAANTPSKTDTSPTAGAA